MKNHTSYQQKLEVLIFINLVFLILIFGNIASAQELKQARKLYYGIDGGFFFPTIKISSSSPTSYNEGIVVRSIHIDKQSKGLGEDLDGVIGFRLNPSISLELRGGIHGFEFTNKTDFKSSEVYTNDTYSANDEIIFHFSGFCIEATSLYKIFSLDPHNISRKFFQTRLGIGVLLSNTNSKITYEEHYWPQFAFINKGENPAKYKSISLMSIQNLPYAKIGIEYNAYGLIGAIDMRIYMPNLFIKQSVDISNTTGTQARRISLPNIIYAPSFSMGYQFGK